MFKDLTLDLALEVFVGVELDAVERRRINYAFNAAVRAGTSIVRRDLPGGIGPWSKGLAARRELEEFFYGALPAKRREGGDDLFGQLCVAQDDDGNEFTDADIVNHMIFLLMAAHDTTTTTMTSMAHQLAKHPEWQARCRAESQAVGRDADHDALAGLTSLDLVMKESLRLCAPVPSIPRRALRDTVIDGYRIPEGAIVASSPYQNHFLDEIWPNPTKFDPERFGPERREDKVHRLAFEPFGAGVHKCIGMHFAGMQVRAIFHQLLLDYEWSVPDGLRDADRPGGAAVRPRRAAGHAAAARPMSDAILDSARDVFETFGARRANVDDVAQAAGVSRSTLYRRFPNKEALLLAVIQRETEVFFDQLDEVAARPAAPGGRHRVLRAGHGDPARDPGAEPARQDRAGHDHRHARQRLAASSRTASGWPRRCAARAPGCPTTSCTWSPSCCCVWHRRTFSTLRARWTSPTRSPSVTTPSASCRSWSTDLKQVRRSRGSRAD